MLTGGANHLVGTNISVETANDLVGTNTKKYQHHSLLCSPAAWAFFGRRGEDGRGRGGGWPRARRRPRSAGGARGRSGRRRWRSRRHGARREDVTARDEEAAAALLRVCLYAGEGGSGCLGKKTVRGGEWSARRRYRATSIWWPEEEEDCWTKYPRGPLVPVGAIVPVGATHRD